MKRPRSKPHVPAGGGPHFDAGDPPPADEPRTIITTVRDAPGAREKIVSLLVELMRRKGGEKG